MRSTGLQLDAVAGEAVDDQAADGAVARRDVEAGERAGAGAVQLDEGAPANPGWVVPSMVTGSMTWGRIEVGEMVCTPPPPTLNEIKSAPAVALASRIAWRSEPAPLL